MADPRTIIVPKAVRGNPARFLFEEASYSATGGQSLSFTVLRAGRDDQTVTVDWAVTGIVTVPASGTITFVLDDIQETVQVVSPIGGGTGVLKLSNPTLVSGIAVAPVLGASVVVAVDASDEAPLPPPGGSPNVAHTINFETGTLVDDRFYPDLDSAGHKTWNKTGTMVNITAMSRSSPTVITVDALAGYAIPFAYEDTPDAGILRGLTGEYSVLNGTLVRFKNFSNGNLTFELWFDHFIPGFMGDGQGLESSTDDSDMARNPLNTSLYSTAWPGGGELEGPFRRIEQLDTINVGSNSDMEIIDSSYDVGDGVIITPRRAGSRYFMKDTIYPNKPYDIEGRPSTGNLKGGNSGHNKPRSQTTHPIDYEFPVNTEFWWGWSLFLSSTMYPNETASMFGGDNLNYFASIDPRGSSNGGIGSIRIGGTNGNTGNNVVQGDPSIMHWWVKHQHHESNVESTNNDGVIWTWLGGLDTDDDWDKWTDLVFRFRWNPMTVAGNPSLLHPDAKNMFLDANTGILEAWKSVGPVIGAPGDPQYRSMVKKHSIVDGSVGSLPGSGANQDVVSVGNRGHYRYGMHRSGPSSILSAMQTITTFTDEIRIGSTIVHGTSYSDVHPTGQADEAIPPADPPVSPYLPIVPGLFSYGTDTTAGRGSHTVYTVTNLNSAGGGSLAGALANAGPKVIIFEVSGMIDITANVNIGVGPCIIAGQTAPAPGIWIYGAGLINNGTDDCLIQHLTLAASDRDTGPASDDRDSFRVQGTSNNVVIDHCTCLWGIDETASVWAFSTAVITNVSYANCIIAEALHKTKFDLTRTCKGLLIGSSAGSVEPTNQAVIRCLFAHNWVRNPFTQDAFIANNLVYNAAFTQMDMRGANDADDGTAHGSYIGNHYKQGPDTTTSRLPIVLRNMLDDSGIFVSDNICDWVIDTGDNFDDLCAKSGVTVLANVKALTSPLVMQGHTVLAGSATEAFVLANAGSRPAQDDFTRDRIIADVVDGTGFLKSAVENTGYAGEDGSAPVPGGKPTIANNTTTHFLPPFPDAFRTVDGYTNLEKWFHDLAVIAEDKGPPANVVIASGTGTYDASTVLPGQVIEVASGDRSTLRINNVQGTLADPILIKSAFDGITTIRRPSSQVGDFLFRLRDCSHCIVDGSYTGGETYGFFITVVALNDEPSSFMHWDGRSSNFKVRKIRVDGAAGTLAPYSSNGVGIQLNDHRASMTLSNNPGAWRENILIEDCDLRNTAASGMYIGPNYGNPVTPDDGIPCRNVEVRRILCRDNGEKGIKMTSMIEGTNSVHHCDIRRTGKDDGEFQIGFQHGIMFFEGGGDVYDNYVEDAGEHGIEIFMFTRPDTFSPINCEIYNNVLVTSGLTQDRPAALPGNGIDVGRNALDIMLPIPHIHHNTSVKSENRGIAVNAHITGGGSVHDNIVAGSGGTQISTPASVSESNNQETTVVVQNFVNEAIHNYRLTSSSPARNNASGVSTPTDDLDGRARPMGIAADQGAYEFVE